MIEEAARAWESDMKCLVRRRRWIQFAASLMACCTMLPGCLGELDGPFWLRFRTGFVPGLAEAITTAFSAEEGAGLGPGLMRLQAALLQGLLQVLTPRNLEA